MSKAAYIKALINFSLNSDYYGYDWGALFNDYNSNKTFNDYNNDEYLMFSNLSDQSVVLGYALLTSPSIFPYFSIILSMIKDIDTLCFFALFFIASLTFFVTRNSMRSVFIETSVLLLYKV